MLNDPFQRLGLDREILTVSQLNQRARLLLEDVFPQIWVEGELSNIARPASGHIYFTLKDRNAQVRCAIFRQQASRVRHLLNDGLLVRVRGRVSLYEGRGDYQMILDSVEAAGDGALRLAFEALKTALQAEGLFSQERKRALPQYPKKIGIITSPNGAVLHDIVSVFKRRAPHVQLTLIPTAVQGQEAIAQIVHALSIADQAQYDALILARGGGSLEDLWCFNEEAVARAIAKSQTPIISAIGHETDVSISDFVADMRAPTPSAAAELLAPDRNELLTQLRNTERQLHLRLNEALKRKQTQLEHLSQRLRHPRERLQQYNQRLDDLSFRLQRAMQTSLQQHKHSFDSIQARLANQHPQASLATQLQHLHTLQQRLVRASQHSIKQAKQNLHSLLHTLHVVSPLATLERGYSILSSEDEQQVVSTVHAVHCTQTLQARLADGYLTVRVENITPKS
ncbi:exodeoxyribonuclease VII large subunit [Denitrificimonas sp. JX-1]|uniref:Exodeoxyribonuclease 7 large subunit n=1 Tax=Denitrificimonas halotolerans TaxID=3098930 RepID=A0ABU5GQA8_9GAMM|nr:exodeoxyribonuclease VII large subunit [Denitrificimonas sp. JX-1]MDY7218717.1 exodeoxyribonuclease VII large subunit [Denitrificimonas sp. JX-1]